MEKITFECESVTPMFISGADGKTPELRSPSIKGAIRFWWRALNGNMSIKTLRNKESKIFGSATEPVGKSKITIRVNRFPNNRDIQRRNIGFEIQDNYDGIRYLFSPLHWRSQQRPYFKAGTKFSISFLFKDSLILNELINSFAFLVFFGGLGAKTRRGAGSFKVNNVIYNSDYYRDLFLVDNITSVEELKNHLESKLKVLVNNSSDNRINTSYSILNEAKVYLLQPESNWKDALEAVAKPYYSFRCEIQSEANITPNFGFPVIHHNGKFGAGPKDHQKRIDGSVIGFLNRRASPLIFKVIKTTNMHYFPTIIWLNGELIPDEYRIMSSRGDSPAKPNKTIIEKFLEKIDNKEDLTL